MRNNGDMRPALAAALTGLVLAAFVSCADPAGGGGGGGAGGGGAGQVRIGYSRAAKTALPGPSEILTFKVTFQGPKKTIYEEFGPKGGTVTLVAGSWNIIVKMYNNEPRLRGIADLTMRIIPGETHDIQVRAAIGVKSVNDLDPSIPGSVTAQYVDPANETLWVLENDISLPWSAWTISSGRHVVIAEPGTTRTITRVLAGGIPGVLNILNPGTRVTLGMAGETGKLVFDGAGIDAAGIGAMLQTWSSGHLVIDGNTEVTRTLNSINPGAAIWAISSGTVELKSGKIHGNRADDGGAVSVSTGGRFIMSGGEISGNTTIGTGWGGYNGGGGAVVVEDGTFEMRGGTITGNRAVNRTPNPSGGGAVWVGGPSTFTMSGGTISGNTADYQNTFNDCASGGGVYVGAISGVGGAFIMSGGTISGNTAQSSVSGNWGRGGGVYVGPSAGFTLSNGSITGNRALGSHIVMSFVGGGGVFIDGGNFTMTGGAISGNSAPNTGYGGGVNYYAPGSVSLPADVRSRISGNTNSGSPSTWPNFHNNFNQSSTTVGGGSWPGGWGNGW
jgi:hypothetical protein